MAPETGELTALISNDAYMVRHYERNQIRRAQAIQKLALSVLYALSVSTEPEEILAALVDGLRPRPNRPF